MKMLRITSCALLLFGLVVARPAQAQTPWGLGPLVGVNLDNDELLVGAVARIPLTSLPITLNPGVEFYPGFDPGSLFVLNFDVQYELNAESLEPYVGAGISWARTSNAGNSDSDVGLNLKGGLVFNPESRTRPYVEAALNFGGSRESLIFRGGLLFTIGG
jgi:hypothetical protein